MFLPEVFKGFWSQLYNLCTKSFWGSSRLLFFSLIPHHSVHVISQMFLFWFTGWLILQLILIESSAALYNFGLSWVSEEQLDGRFRIHIYWLQRQGRMQNNGSGFSWETYSMLSEFILTQ